MRCCLFPLPCSLPEGLGNIEIPIEYQDEIRNAEMVQIVILKPNPSKKSFSKTGIIAKLTANPIQVAGFKPLTTEEANERW